MYTLLTISNERRACRNIFMHVVVVVAPSSSFSLAVQNERAPRHVIKRVLPAFTSRSSCWPSSTTVTAYANELSSMSTAAPLNFGNLSMNK
jgi:hypothetical protein